MTIRTIIGGIAFSIFSVGSSHAQKLNLSVTLPSDTLKATSLSLSNELRNTDIRIPLTGNSVYKSAVIIPDKGFYQLENVGKVYLVPKNNLQVTSADMQTYSFKGKQAQENELLVKLALLRKQLLPENTTLLGIPTFTLLKQSVQEFLVTVATYKNAVAELVAPCSNLHFNELAIGDADSYSRVMLLGFGQTHELDSALYQQSKKFLEDPDSKRDPNFYLKSLRARVLPLYDGLLNEEDTEIIRKAYTDGFDLNNKTLLLNSPWYGRVLSAISFTDIPTDERTLHQSYAKKFEAIPTKFKDEQFAEEMRAQQGLDYLKFVKTIGGNVDEAYQKIGTFSLADSTKQRIEKAYLQLKKPTQL
ncbi:hypothetical protein D3C87_183500 [compost metagenome]